MCNYFGVHYSQLDLCKLLTFVERKKNHLETIENSLTLELLNQHHLQSILEGNSAMHRFLMQRSYSFVSFVYYK